MTEAEEQLEHAIWQAMRVFKVSTDEPWMFIDCVMHAARVYAVGDDVELTKARREALRLATAPLVGQTPASGCGRSGQAASELHPSGSAAEQRSQMPAEGATLSTGAGIPDTPKMNGGN